MADTEILLMVRALMRRLWQKYDAGGHSMGRSPRSKLLEAAMYEFPSEDLPQIPDDTWETFRDIQKLVRGDEFVECHSAILSELSPEMYVTLVMKAIRDLTRREVHPSIIEENLIRTVLHLLRAKRRIQAYRDKGGRQVSDRDLIEEGQRRIRERSEKRKDP